MTLLRCIEGILELSPRTKSSDHLPQAEEAIMGRLDLTRRTVLTISKNTFEMTLIPHSSRDVSIVVFLATAWKRSATTPGMFFIIIIIL